MDWLGCESNRVSGITDLMVVETDEVEGEKEMKMKDELGLTTRG